MVISEDEESQQCRTCRERTDPGQMLVCSSCEAAHHLYCLNPGLNTRPDQPLWFCPDCQPRERKITESSPPPSPPAPSPPVPSLPVIVSTSSVAESEDLNQNRKTARRRWNIIDSGAEEEERRLVRRTRSSFPAGRIVEARGQKLNISRFQTLVRALIRHKDCWPFDEPITKEEVPDYHDIITHPMDFGTIQ